MIPLVLFEAQARWLVGMCGGWPQGVAVWVRPEPVLYMYISPSSLEWLRN